MTPPPPPLRGVPVIGIYGEVYKMHMCTLYAAIVSKHIKTYCTQTISHEVHCLVSGSVLVYAKGGSSILL